MKNILYVLFVFTFVILAGCGQKSQPEEVSQEKAFAYTQKEDQRYMLTKWQGCDLLDDAQHNSYSVPWPEEGMMSVEAQRELLKCYFNDTTSATFEEAAKQWVMTNWYAEDFDVLYENVYQDTVPQESSWGFNFCHLNGHVEENGNLVLFWYLSSAYMGGAHTINTEGCRVYDRDAAKMVHLEDLFDMDDFEGVIANAINDLDVNQNVRDNIYIEGDRKRAGVFVPDNYSIDSARTCITLMYQAYDIACGASGPQKVTLPISWLAEQHLLTPYAKSIFKVE